VVLRPVVERAGLEQPPPNLRSYCLTDGDVAMRRAALHAELRRAGDVCAVFLDGVADLAFGVNDEAEAIALADGDRPAFETLLRQALAASDKRTDLDNQIMRQRAQWLLESADELF
jgi:hypothetical protein